jgi:hypothetical protein
MSGEHKLGGVIDLGFGLHLYSDALEFATATNLEALEPTSVTPEEIEAICANHDFTRSWGFLGLGEGLGL